MCNMLDLVKPAYLDKSFSDIDRDSRCENDSVNLGGRVSARYLLAINSLCSKRGDKKKLLERIFDQSQELKEALETFN